MTLRHYYKQYLGSKTFIPKQKFKYLLFLFISHAFSKMSRLSVKACLFILSYFGGFYTC